MDENEGPIVPRQRNQWRLRGAVLALGLVLSIVGVEIAMEDHSDVQHRLRQLLARLQSAAGIEIDERLAMARDSLLIKELAAAIPEQPSEVRRRAAELLADIGRPVLAEDDDHPERFAPCIDDACVAACLVGLLSDDDPGIRDFAGRILSQDVPDLLVRNHSQEVMLAVFRYPNVSGGALVLGLTGAERARRFLEENEVIQDVSPDDVRSALGRLGDHEAERQVIDDYLKTDDPEARAEIAIRAGYMATPRAILMLATDMRSPETYEWQMKSRRSFRVHVIEGLHRAFLTEPLFWKPFYKPEDDSYYDRIEKWLMERVGVRWERERPEFLYQEDAPIIRE